MNRIADAKKMLRASLRAALSRVSPEQRDRQSAAAVQRLLATPVWQRSAVVLLYAPMRSELDVWPLLDLALANGRTVALPRYDADRDLYCAARICDPHRELTSGPLGIREPGPTCEQLDLKRLDLILVPGLGFDRNGHRLGRGRGFYDRLLAQTRGVLCGVALEEQVMPSIPVEAHDVILDCLLTPSHWLTFSQRAV